MTSTSAGTAASDLFAGMGSVATKTQQLDEIGSQALDKIESFDLKAGQNVSEQIEQAITHAEQRVKEAAEREMDFEKFKERVDAEMASVDLSGAQAKRKAYEEDFRTVTFALLGEMQNLDTFYAEVSGECPEADAEIADSVKRVERARHNLGAAEAGLDYAKAQTPGIFEFITKARRKAVDTASVALRSANVELAEAEADIEPAKRRAEEIRRDRIMQADISGLLQIFQQRSTRVVNLAVEQLGVLQDQIDTVIADRVKTVSDKEAAEKALQQVEADLEKQEQEIRRLQDEKAGTVDPSRKAELDTEIANAQNVLRTLANNRNRKYMYAQSKTRGMEMLTQTEEALRSLYGSIDAYQLMLKSDTEYRITAFDAGVEIMQSMDHLQSIELTNQVGATTDQRHLDIALQASLSAERALLKGMEGHKGRMSEMQHLAKRFAENKAKIDDAILEELAGFFRQHGVDGRDQSSLSHREIAGIDTTGAATNAG